MRVAIVYFVTMILVIFGVFGITRIGEGLDAPVSVKGTWVIDTLQATHEAEVCEGSLTWAENPSLIIVQSGPELVITLGDTRQTTLRGTLQNLEIEAEEIHPHDTTRGLEFAAQVDRQVEPDRLEGILKLPRCGGAFEVAAARQPGELRAEGSN